jgi:uncharacterized protein (DUF2225 family)
VTCGVTMFREKEKEEKKKNYDIRRKRKNDEPVFHLCMGV